MGILNRIREKIITGLGGYVAIPISERRVHVTETTAPIRTLRVCKSIPKEHFDALPADAKEAFIRKTKERLVTNGIAQGLVNSIDLCSFDTRVETTPLGVCVIYGCTLRVVQPPEWGE